MAHCRLINVFVLFLIMMLEDSYLWWCSLHPDLKPCLRMPCLSSHKIHVQDLSPVFPWKRKPWQEAGTIFVDGVQPYRGDVHSWSGNKFLSSLALNMELLNLVNRLFLDLQNKKCTGVRKNASISMTFSEYNVDICYASFNYDCSLKHC